MPENDGPELLRTPQSRPSNPNGSRWHCLFKNVSFSAGNLIMFVIGFCLYSSIMLIPLFLQTLIGYSATDAGMFNLLRNIGGSVGIAMAATLLACYQQFIRPAWSPTSIIIGLAFLTIMPLLLLLKRPRTNRGTRVSIRMMQTWNR